MPKTRRRPEAGLTPMQTRVLESLTKFWEQRGYPPTLSPLGFILGRAPNTVLEHLENLDRKHWVRKTGPPYGTKWTPLNLCPQCGSVVKRHAI